MGKQLIQVSIDVRGCDKCRQRVFPCNSPIIPIKNIFIPIRTSWKTTLRSLSGDMILTGRVILFGLLILFTSLLAFIGRPMERTSIPISPMIQMSERKLLKKMADYTYESVDPTSMFLHWMHQWRLAMHCS